MPYKVCTFCGKTSYSASEASEIKWLCPYCEQDISHVPSFFAPPKKQESSGDKESA
ncbi:MAG: hypothetical protein KGZ57_03740 [Dethiobacter sp.]|nr:hypothetical protein [Dethiobacter sp.]